VIDSFTVCKLNTPVDRSQEVIHIGPIGFRKIWPKTSLYLRLVDGSETLIDRDTTLWSPLPTGGKTQNIIAAQYI